MDTTRFTENVSRLKELKLDAQAAQKKGLPFIMASVVIWAMILGVQFLDQAQTARNLYAFVCSCALIPLAYFFSKIVKADIFRKTKNPIDKLGFLCTMNQMLYLIIVIWAYGRNPGAMIMLYAMIFGAHLFPFAWVYDSKAYMIAAVVETVGALVSSLIAGNVMTCGFMIVMEVVLCILLFIENRKVDAEMKNPASGITYES